MSSCSQQQKWILSLASLSEDPQSQVSKQKPFQILSLRTSSYQTRPSTLGEAEPRRRIGQAIGVRKHSLGSLPPSFSFTSNPPLRSSLPSSGACWLFLLSSFLRSFAFVSVCAAPPPAAPQYAGPGAGPELLHDALHLRFLGFFHYHTPTLNSKPVASAVSQVTQQLLIGGTGYPSACTLSLFHSPSFQLLWSL